MRRAVKVRLLSWLACLMLGIDVAPGQESLAESAVDAIAIASAQQAIKKRLAGKEKLRVTARFVEQWKVWMVEFFEGDDRSVFATVNSQGNVLETGPGDDREGDRERRVQELLEELERARRAENKAEMEEIRTLLKQMGASREARGTVDSDALLDSFHTLGSYGMAILRWSSSGRGTVRIEKRVAQEPWNTIARIRAREGVWIDEQLPPNTTFAYRISFISAEGVSSRPSREWKVRIKELSESTLPLYALKLPEEGRQRMLENVTEDIPVEGTLRLGGVDHPVKVRLRGASTRHAAKKSYRVQFREQSPLERKVTYLKAEAMDHTMQQEKLSCDIFRSAGAAVSKANYVNLVINGRYEGVYLDIEPIRAPFKKNPGLNPDGTLIRAATFQHLVGWEGLGDLRGDVGSLDQLRTFIARINRTERGEFERFVRAETDWPRVRDYLALQVICHRSEIEADDYLFYRAPDSDKWWFLPRDHNNGNFNVIPFGNRVGEPYMHPYWQTIQQLNWRPSHWFVLPSRIFQNRQLRSEYLDRLEQLIDHLARAGKIDRLIERNHDQLKNEYVIDPYRKPYGKRDPFLRSDLDLKRFMERHTDRLMDQIREERRRTEPALCINEFAFTGTHTGWVELRNAGTRPVELTSYALATKTETGNWLLPMEKQPVLAAGALRVVHFGGEQGQWRWQGEHDRERPRASTQENALQRTGGFLALLKRRSGGEGDERNDQRRETVIDFYFYGEQEPGSSYGRQNDGFGQQRPSPGK